jgi:hypothetical protein
VSEDIMKKTSTGYRALLALLVAACLCACSSKGALARRWQRSMLDDAEPGTDAKVVVIRVPDPGRLTPTIGALGDLERAPGVRAARRGAGEDELYALVDGYVDPETLVGSLERDGHEAWLVRVVTRADLEEEDKK